VQTKADYGNIKRIRKNGGVNMTPCKMDVMPTGSWVPTSAREVTGAEIAQKVELHA
jgi:hypothetical protein